MKKLSVLALASVALLFSACGGNNKTATSEEQKVAEKTGDVYAVNLDSSKVTWKATHKGGFAPRWGTIAIKSGEISSAEGQVTSADFVIDMMSIKTDTASVTEKDKKASELEAHLKSPDFFNVEKIPTAEFKVTKISDLATAPADAVTGANKTVSGNLTLLGKTLNVTFPAKITVDATAVSVLAKFIVNRTDWGIKFGSTTADPAEWMISKDIEIGIDVKAAK